MQMGESNERASGDGAPWHQPQNRCLKEHERRVCGLEEAVGGK